MLLMFGIIHFCTFDLHFANLPNLVVANWRPAIDNIRPICKCFLLVSAFMYSAYLSLQLVELFLTFISYCLVAFQNSMLFIKIIVILSL